MLLRVIIKNRLNNNHPQKTIFNMVIRISEIKFSFIMYQNNVFLKNRRRDTY